jgi:hypothetical protein
VVEAGNGYTVEAMRDGRAVAYRRRWHHSRLHHSGRSKVPRREFRANEIQERAMTA